MAQFSTSATRAVESCSSGRISIAAALGVGACHLVDRAAGPGDAVHWGAGVEVGVGVEDQSAEGEGGEPGRRVGCPEREPALSGDGLVDEPPEHVGGDPRCAASGGLFGEVV